MAKRDKTIIYKLKSKIKKLYSGKPDKILTKKAIAKRINFSGSGGLLYKVIKQLENEGFLVETSRGKFSAHPNAMPKTLFDGKEKTLVGRVDKTRSGAGYIIVDGREEDIYVPSKKLRGALNNDIVEVEIERIKRNRKPEGFVRRIVERSVKDVVAKIYSVSNRAYAIPLMEMGIREIAIPLNKMKNAQEGDVVLLKIDQFPESGNRTPLAHVLRVITDYETHEVSELSILTKYGFNYIFPDHISGELKNIEHQGVQWKPEDRRDFRDVLTFTIDPEDAKDFDDALSFEEFEDGEVEIGVHIADVTHYIEKGGQLDKEAEKRATSVYLVGRVCPMLPETLSNDLCSLVEGEDRLTFAVVFRVSPQNKIVNTWIGKTVIHSNQRLAYEQAQDIIDGEENELKPALDRIKKFADFHRKLRNKKGAINFDSEEIRFLLDEKKHPTDIYIKERKASHLLVEDLMLLANKSVAEFIDKQSKGRIPLPYRVHDEPDMEKIQDVALMSKVLGFEFNIDNTKSIRESFNRLHDAAQKNETLKTLSQLGIRSMAKAVYTTENIGHFGLAFEHYAHFTSPIRRYADVLVHRVVYAFLQKEKTPYDQGKLEAICGHISRRERMAMDAERESIKLKQAEYMKQFEGEIFEGKVSGMIDRGLFVLLKDGAGEGLIDFDDFDESFDLHASGFTAKGRKTGRIFAVGDRLQVHIDEVNIEKRQIDLSLAE